MLNNLINEMTAAGLILDSAPVLDGKIHRTRVSEKKQKNGWYSGITLNENIYCTFGRWDSDLKIKWKSNGHKKISEADAGILRMIAQKNKQQTESKHASAADAAQKLWQKATPTTEHPYLKKKKIRPHNSRIYNDILLIPIYDSTGALVNLQRISAENDKKFLYGGKISGCASAIIGDDTVCICEGFATAASIHESTKHTVIMAFSASNLLNIVESAKEKNPNAKIIICADNDNPNPTTGLNTGEYYGKLAAKKINAVFRMPPAPGTDFNDLPKHEIKSIINAPENILSEADIKDDSLTLNIPKELFENAGLISVGLAAALAAGAPDIIQINLPIIFTMIARALSNKISCCGQWCSLYNIKITPTSIGKTDSDKIFKEAIIRHGIERFYGPTDFSSGPGLLRGMADAGLNQCLVTIDEATYIFKRTKNDIVGNSKISALLELYTNAGTEINKPYGNNKDSIVIKNPCLNLVGNATPGIFDDIQIEDFTSGILQRFDFWCYDGKIPYRRIPQSENKAMNEFIIGLNTIMTAVAPMKNNHDARAIIGVYDLPLSRISLERLELYSRKIVDDANDYDGDDGIRGMISRKYHLAIKYAMIHHAALSNAADFFKPLSIEHLEWGITMAELLSEWKIKVLSGKITAGQFHKDCEIFKEGIVAVMRKRQKPSIKMITDRKKRLKELKPKDLQDVIQTLIERNEIIADTSGFNTIYWLSK